MQDEGESQSAFLAGIGAGASPLGPADTIATALPEPGKGAVRRWPVGGDAPARLDPPPGEGGASLGPSLAEAPLRGMIALRTDLGHPDVEAALMNAIGLRAPARRKAVIDGDRGALWMAPDELLIMTPVAEVAARMALIDQTLGSHRRLLVDLSDARAIFRLSGRGAREVLAKGAPVDLHPESFHVGDLRRTRLSTVAAALYQTSAAPETFEVLCFRSHAPAVWRWLAASSAPASLPHVFG